VIAEARRVVEAWRDPEVWESDHLYDCIRDLEKAMVAGQFMPASPSSGKAGGT
jgi:hypothetical protein